MLAHNPRIVTDGLVLCLDAANPKSYPGSGTTWKDLSKNSNDGTLINGVGYSEDNQGSMVFDGVNDRADTNYTLINGTDASPPINIEFVINPDETQPEVTRAPLWIGSAYYSGFGMRYTGSIFQIWLRTSAGIFTNTLPLQSGVFQHVVLGYGGQANPSMYSYINGILNTDRSVTFAAFNLNLSSYPFRIALPQTTGGSSASGYFNGKIASVKIYNRALSESEIKQNFQALRGRYGI